jgi:hypothetical protein
MFDEMAATGIRKEPLGRHGPPMVAAAERVLDEWTPGETRDIANEMMRIRLDITAKAHDCEQSSLTRTRPEGHDASPDALAPVLILPGVLLALHGRVG